jgi:penicillin-binding protein 1A
VWIGRDDAKPIPGLHGGTAPARTFADFMKVAVAGRPVEQFDTGVTLPQELPDLDENAYFGAPDNGLFVDPDGNPVQPGMQQPDQGDDGGDQGDQPLPPPQEKLDQQWMDRVLNRSQQPRDSRPAPGAPPVAPRTEPHPQDSRPNQ